MLKTADFRDFCRGLWRIAFASVFGILSFVCLGYGEAVHPDEPSHTVIYSCGYVVPLSEFSVETLSGGSGGKDGGQSGGSSSPVSVSGTPPVDETCNDSSRCSLFSIDSVDNNPCASAGYTFDHWECNHWGVAINWEEDGYGGGSWNSYFDMSDHMAGSGYTFEQIEESCNDTVYCEAKWVKTDYTVSFSTGTHGNGSMTPLTKNYTDTVTLPSNGFTADAGYRFVNWKDLKSSVYKNAGQTFTMPAENVTWVAQWTLINYTVSFDANGGSGTTGGQTNKHIGDTITLPSSAFTAPTGYQFNGWNCGASVNNGNDLQPGNTFTMPAENVTCVAQWLATDYTVSFAAGVGSGTMNGQTNKHYGDTITLPPNSFTAPNGNYLFVGWNCGANVNNGNNLNAGNTFAMPAGNVTCTAQWSACSCDKGTGVNTCSVTGVSNNQCQYSYTCDSNYHVSRQNNDVQNGTFAGNAGVTNNSISCEEDELTYNVVYNCNNNDDGIDPEDGHSPYTVGTRVTVLSDESTCKIPVGKRFSGWFCYKTGDKNTKVDDRPFRMPAYDVTCDAQWEDVNYTVSFAPGSADGVSATGNTSSLSNKHYNNIITLPDSTFAAPTPAGKYTFDKWNCDNSIGDKAPAATFSMPAADVTCTAQWKLINYNVTYYGGNCTSNLNSYTDATTATYGSTYSILQATNGNLVNNIISLDVNNSCARFRGWSASSDSSVLTYPCLKNNSSLDYGGLTCIPQLTITNYPASNTSLYAVCDPRTYDVVYHNDCAELVNQTSTDSNGLTYGVPYTLKGLNSTAMPNGISMPAGYSFTGWKINGITYTNLNPTYTYTSSDKCSAGPIDAYAGCESNEYNVYYYTDANSQTPVASSIVTMGGTYAIGNTSAENASCTSSNESFDEWNCSYNNNSGYVETGNPVVAYDVHCRPECIVNMTTYNVSFAAGAGSGTMSDQTGKHYGDTITLPVSTFTPPTPAGKYTFDKWNCDNGIGNRAAGATFSMPAANVTCTAQWKLKNYTVGFVRGDSNNNGTGTSATGSAYYITKQYQTTVTLPENTYFTAPSGYEFDKWKCDNSVGEKMVGDTFSMPTANVTCTAQWRQVAMPVSTTTVSFVCAPSNATTLRPEVSPETVYVGEEYRFVSEDVCTLNNNSGWEFKSVGCFDGEDQSVLVTSDKDEIIIDNVPNSPVTCSLYYGPTGVDVYSLDICTGSGYTNNPTQLYYGSGNTPYLNYTNGALANVITASPDYLNPITVPNNACFIGYSYDSSCVPNASGLNYPLFNSYGEWTGQYIGNGWAQYLNSKYAIKLDSTGASAGGHGTEFLWHCSDNDPLSSCNGLSEGWYRMSHSGGNYSVMSGLVSSGTNYSIDIPTKTGYVFAGYFSAQNGGIRYIDENGKGTANMPSGMPSGCGPWYAHWCESGQTVNSDGTCNAGCGQGYHSSYMGQVFDEVVDVSEDGKGYFGDELNRQRFFSDSNDGTLVNLYGLLSSHAGGEYGVLFDGANGPVATFGTSMCTETPGSNNWQTNPQSYINDWLKPTASLSQNAGEYCWCTFDGYSLDGKNVIEINTDLWVYADKFLSGVDCQEKCASKCAESLQKVSDFRGAMFKNLEGCFPETYDITYYGCDGRTAVLVEDALTYNENYTILDIGDTGLDSTGYVFNGWNTSSNVSYSVGASNSPWTQTNGLTLYADCDEIRGYSVTYNCNNSGQGTTPTDNNLYQQNTSVTTQQNTCWAPLGKEFSRWNCGGTYVNAGNSFTITSNTTCAAEWADVNPCEQGDTPTFYSAVPEEYISQNSSGMITENNLTWAVFDYANISLEGLCSSRAGGFSDAFYDGYGTPFLNSNQAYDGSNCWCVWAGTTVADGISGVDGFFGNRFRVVFSQSFADHNQCETNCTSSCLNALASNASFRRSMYSSVQCQPMLVRYDCGVGAGGSAIDPDNPYSVGTTVNVLSGAGSCTAPIGYNGFEQWNCSIRASDAIAYNPDAPIHGYTVGDTSFVMPNAEVVCSAQWTPINYTVSFAGGYSNNDGTGTAATGEMSAQTGVHYADTITLPDNGNNPPANGFSLDGYTFSGWKCGSSVNNNATLAANDTFSMPAANVTCTAQWTANAPTTYTVTYDCNNNNQGTNPASEGELESGQTVNAPSGTSCNAPTGQHFAGWYCGANINSGNNLQPGDTFTMPAANVTCNAQWSVNTIYLAWLLNGGTITETNAPMCTYGTSAGQNGSITPIHDPTRNGYRFTGWNISTIENSGYTRLAYLDSDGNQYIDTGFTPNGDYKHTIVFDVLDTDEGYLCGTSSSNGRSGNTKMQNKRLVAVNNHSASDVSAIASVLQTPTDLVSGRNTLVLNLRDNASNTITLNGSNNLAYGTSSSITSTETIKLFRAGAISTSTIPMRIYYDLIEQNGVPVKILVPVKIDSTGEIGMYDLVNQVFLPNSGTGTFTGPAQ